MKDWAVVVVACSATESTKGLVVVRNGVIALRYLKDGRPRNLEVVLVNIMAIPAIIIPPKK